MNPLLQRTTLLATCLLWTACGSETAQDADAHDHSGFTFSVWPESGSTVFSETAMYVGSPMQADHVHGTIGILVGGDAPTPGSTMPSGAQQFAAGATSGSVKLPAGEQTVHVCLFGEDGKATAEMQTATYTVEAKPSDLGVRWLAPADGATVKSPFTVEFGLAGAEISPAGNNSLDKTVGHHHISIGNGPVTAGLMVPMEDPSNYLHFGKGQTSAEVTLEPGEYELTMQFADAGHRSYGAAMTSTITVTVE